MPEFVVAGEPRTETGKNANRRLRQQGRIPAVVYANKKATEHVSVSPKDLGAILRSASGENTLFDLDVGGTRRKVILKDYQVEPLKGELLHADLFEVALDKQLEVSVHVELVGTPRGVKVEGGILDFVTRELEVRCLPTDIPEKITVDVSDLGLGQHLRVSQIGVPERVEMLTEPEVVVAHVVVRRAEVTATEEEVVAEEGAEAAAPAAAEGAEPDKKADKKPDKKSDKKTD